MDAQDAAEKLRDIVHMYFDPEAQVELKGRQLSVAFTHPKAVRAFRDDFEHSFHQYPFIEGHYAADLHRKLIFYREFRSHEATFSFPPHLIALYPNRLQDFEALARLRDLVSPSERLAIVAAKDVSNCHLVASDKLTGTSAAEQDNQPPKTTQLRLWQD